VGIKLISFKILIKEIKSIALALKLEESLELSITSL